ncbi:hypothetical protein COV17_02325 [Candidatus Woesearchaeota archaeon CG10_big_fil_rev_8_21_14_0_10_36_11]|nr:MAG: hypothetical protein COV17_02325 [Candidatus Woesearchaeota archaeon CG10_big_fil_rev_8_21_14_0_10_36_11]
MEDRYGNHLFLKDYPYNQTVWYGECNDDFTNCMIYSSFLINNNLDKKPCFEYKSINSEEVGGYWITKVIKRDYFYENPLSCVDVENIA